MRILAGVVFALGVVASSGATPGLPAPTALTQPTPALPSTIPLFPLPDVVLFPEMSVPLHIFEPRYRAMVADALAGDRTIGMVLLRAGYEAEYAGNPPIHPIGCAGVITDVEEFPDGRYNIVLQGAVKFRVIDEDRDRSYRLGHVEAIPETMDAAGEAELHTLRPALGDLFATAAPSTQRPPPGLDDRSLVNGLAQVLPLDPADRQALLEADGPLARARGLLDLLNGAAAPPR